MVAGGLWENGEMATGDEFDALLVEAGRTPMRGWEYDYGGRIRLEPWYLLNLPWVFPGFSFRRHRERLRGLHESGKPLAVRQFLFWLEARSPQAARG